MNTSPEKIDLQRRQLVGVAALSAVIAQLGGLHAANAQPPKPAMPLIAPGRTPRSATAPAPVTLQALARQLPTSAAKQ